MGFSVEDSAPPIAQSSHNHNRWWIGTNIPLVKYVQCPFYALLWPGSSAKTVRYVFSGGCWFDNGILRFLAKINHKFGLNVKMVSDKYIYSTHKKENRFSDRCWDCRLGRILPFSFFMSSEWDYNFSLGICSNIWAESAFSEITRSPCSLCQLPIAQE